jgi:hypothetical protein
VTGVRRTSDAVAEAVFVARAPPDASLVGSGSVELGLGRELVDPEPAYPVEPAGSLAA